MFVKDIEKLRAALHGRISKDMAKYFIACDSCNQMVIWLSPQDCVAPHGLNRGDLNKVKWLYDLFVEDGFDENKSALIGYPLEGKIQLLSGTHRHKAAELADIKLPVSLWLRSDIEACWGGPQWFEIMQDIPVKWLTSTT